MIEKDDLEDLLPDDLHPAKKGAEPLKRTPAQQRRAAARAEKAAQAKELALATTEAQARAAKLAQVINLHIAGYSMAQIGAQIGASADEVDWMLSTDTARYVRNQPQLRTYVRNWVSQKYNSLLEANWDAATDKTHPSKLENQDRVIRILERMTKLHGAEAPAQSEVRIEAAPEAVEKMVNSLAASQGLGYDDSIFDIVDAEVVSEASEQLAEAVDVSGNAVEVQGEGESDDGF